MDLINDNKKFIKDLTRLREERSPENAYSAFGRARRFNLRPTTRTAQGSIKTYRLALKTFANSSLLPEINRSDTAAATRLQFRSKNDENLAVSAQSEEVDLPAVPSSLHSVPSQTKSTNEKLRGINVSTAETGYEFFTRLLWPTTPADNAKNSPADSAESLALTNDALQPVADSDDALATAAVANATEICEYSAARVTLPDDEYQEAVSNNSFLVSSAAFDRYSGIPESLQRINDAESGIAKTLIGSNATTWPRANRDRMICRLSRGNELSCWLNDWTGVKTVSYPASEKQFKLVGSNSTGHSLFVTAPLRHSVEPWKIPALIANRPNVIGLNINIQSIRFRHHPLMNIENVIERRLVSTMEVFESLNISAAQETLRTKIQQLKLAIAASTAATENLPDDADDDEEDSVVRSRLKQLLQSILDVRVQLDREYSAEQDMLAVIFELWKSLLDHRSRSNGFTSTSTLLRIGKTNSDADKDMQLYRESFEEEMSERRLLGQLVYETQVRAYQRQLQRKKEAKRRLRDSKLAGYELSREDLHTLHKEPDYVKPVAPHEHGVEAIKALKQRIISSRRQPGAAIIRPHIATEEAVALTPVENCLNEEQRRRQILARTRIQVKISVNDQLVTTLESQPIDSTNFTVAFKSLTPIYLQQPAAVKLEIVELRATVGAASSRVLGTVFIPPPPPLSAAYQLDESAYDKIEFTTSDTAPVVFRSRINAVGSGVQVNVFDSKKPELLLTNGIVVCRTFWSPDSDAASTQRVLPLPKVDDFDSIRKNGVCQSDEDIATLRDWLAEMPNDDTAALSAEDNELVELLRRFLPLNDAVGDDFKPFRQLQNEFDFCSDEDIRDSARFRLLQLRDAGGPDFVNLKMIPPTDRHIEALASSHLLDRRVGWTQRTALQVEANGRDNTNIMRKLDFLRSLDGLCESITYRLNAMLSIDYESGKSRQQLEQVVYEDDTPTFRTFFALSDGPSLFAERRPLKPTAVHKRRPVAADEPVETKLHVRIERAFNLPIRAGVMPLSGTQSQVAPQVLNPTNLPLHLLQPFVEVRLADKLLLQTGVAEGPQPAWNEQHTISLNAMLADGAWTWNELVRYDIEISVFDQIALDVSDGEQQQGTYIHKGLQNYWLCSKTIPLTDLICRTTQREICELRLQMPLVLAGYYALPAPPITNAAVNDTVVPVQQPMLEIYFALDCSTAFSLKNDFNSPLLLSKLDSVETAQTLNAVDLWLDTLHRRKATRFSYPSPLCLNTKGLTALWCRYVASVEPPKNLFPADRHPYQQMETLAYYVSLFPVTPHVGDAPGFQVFTDTEQFVTLKVGEDRQHAVLLASYFISLKVPEVFLLVSCTLSSRNPGMCSFFALSRGFPPPLAAADVETGNAVVENNYRNLRKDKYLIWAASDGRHYAVDDATCPIENVHYIVSSTNIYANIQLSSKPMQMDFNLNRQTNWLPLLAHAGVVAKNRSIQTTTFSYDVIYAGWREEIQDHIKHRLIQEITTKRGVGLITRWNRQLSIQLRILLNDMEQPEAAKDDGTENVVTRLSSLYSKHMAALQQFTRGNTVGMYGYPLHINHFTSIGNVCDMVMKTGIYAIDSSRVEFGVAVQCTAYPGKVLSVWVYVVSLISPANVGN